MYLKGIKKPQTWAGTAAMKFLRRQTITARHGVFIGVVAAIVTSTIGALTVRVGFRADGIG